MSEQAGDDEATRVASTVPPEDGEQPGPPTDGVDSPDESDGREVGKSSVASGEALARRPANGPLRAIIATVLVLFVIGFSAYVIYNLIGRLSARASNTTSASGSSDRSSGPGEWITTTDVNVRLGPGKGHPKIGLIEANSRVEILDTHNNWRKVRVRSRGRPQKDPDSANEGWVDGRNLKSNE